MELSLESIFGLVIGAIILLVIGSVIMSLIWSPAEVDDATLSSFNEIARVIRAVEEKGSYKENISLVINEPFIITGFNKGELVKYPEKGEQALIYRETASGRRLSIYNLQSPCSGKTCLCICTSTSTTAGKYVYLKDNNCVENKETCVIFDKIESFKIPKFSENFIFFLYWNDPKERYALLEGSKNVVSLK